MTDENNGAFAKRRSIRSFIIREGRMTRGQERALETGWPRFGLEYQTTPLNMDDVFPETRNNPLTLEIGFGDGEVLFELAKRFPEQNFIGIEVHRPGVGHVLMRLQEAELSNTRIIKHDAMDVLENMIGDHCLDRVNLYFADPWPKKRHHKRRIVQPDFLKLLDSKLKSNGIIHFATDWHPYAEHMCAVLQQSEHFHNTKEDAPTDTAATPDEVCVPRPDSRPLTKFEKRGHRKGHGVWDFVFRKNQ